MNLRQASELAKRARASFDDLDLDDLPAFLMRNSRDYYYLSVYPSLGAQTPFEFAENGGGPRPDYPEIVRNAYVHIPFCSGVCDFCSYYLIAVRGDGRQRRALAAYLDLLRREILFHAEGTELEISYLYFGGGTPSLIPPPELESFLAFLGDRGFLSEKFLGTLELHPELFSDEPRARELLAVMRRRGLGRVSLGYQVSDEKVLDATNRRHGADFLPRAVELVRQAGLIFNLDLMYGLYDQSLESWGRTLGDALETDPDSISTYFLFADPGTHLATKLRRGEVELPDHRAIQIQNLMARLALADAGYVELPSDFFARPISREGKDAGSAMSSASNPGYESRPEGLPSQSHTLPLGPGAYGFYDRTQLCNVFDLGAYRERVEARRSPLWRGYRLGPKEMFHRDVMFALKNDPYLDSQLFREAYGATPAERFPRQVDLLRRYDLADVSSERLTLTLKGRLMVEEIASLFSCRRIREQSTFSSEAERRRLSKHSYSPSYGQR